MIESSELQRRLEAARGYFDIVREFLRNHQFSDLHATWDQLSVIEQFAAINPRMYEQYVDPVDVLGPRIFGREINRMFRVCMCDMLWGYSCPFVGASLQADHAFPYGLGGATDSTNLLVLCANHNQAKGHDVHLYLWPETSPPWLRRTADKINALIEQRARKDG